MRCTLATCACSRACCARRWNKRAAPFVCLYKRTLLGRAHTRLHRHLCAPARALVCTCTSASLCRSHAPARALVCTCTSASSCGSHTPARPLVCTCTSAGLCRSHAPARALVCTCTSASSCGSHTPARPLVCTCTSAGLCRSHAPARALARVHAARARVRSCLCLRRRKQMRLVASCQLGRDLSYGIARAAEAAPVAAKTTHHTTDQPIIIFAPVVSTILHRVPAQSMC